MCFVLEAIAKCLSERKAGFRADAQITKGGNLVIDTRHSRRPSQSNNGGDYYGWLVVRPDGYIRHKSSCDFWQPDDEYWQPSDSRDIGGEQYYRNAIDACAAAGILE